jgi:hypothetical protein
MKALDDIINKLDSLYIPIYVKGKIYPGNNPYILNEINNMLKAGWIKNRYGGLTEPIEPLYPNDLKWDDGRIQWFDEEKDCIYNEELEKINFDICEEINRLSIENNERLSMESKK